jgi:hypothetical protein
MELLSVTRTKSIPLCGLLIPEARKVDHHGNQGIQAMRPPPKPQGSITVKNSKLEFLKRAAGVLVGVGLLGFSSAVIATEQSKDRQAGRDVNQDTKQKARKEKVDCRAADQQSNAECRQDKRDTKQEGREDKRDTKRQ